MALPSQATLKDDLFSGTNFHDIIIFCSPPFTSITAQPYLQADVLSNVGNEVVHLAKLNTVLAKDVVGGSKVEKEVGNDIAGDIVLAGHVSVLAGAHANGDSLVLAAVDRVLGGFGQVLLGDVDAGVKVGEGLEGLAVQRGRLDARQTRGDFAAKVGDHVNLEGQGKHVVDDAGLGQASGIGGRLGLLEDGGQGSQAVLDSNNGEVVEAHGD